MLDFLFANFQHEIKQYNTEIKYPFIIGKAAYIPGSMITFVADMKAG